MNDFSTATVRSLRKIGVRVVGLTTIPDYSSATPYASGDTGYVLDDNGTQRVRSFAQVLALVA